MCRSGTALGFRRSAGVAGSDRWKTRFDRVLYLCRVRVVARRMSSQTEAVLSSLAVRPTTWRHGYDLCRELGLKSGVLYPILMRLADRRLLESKWEPDPPRGRPPRHLYRLTPDGRATASDLVRSARRTNSGAAQVQVAGSNT
jgi:DNA-binding PadR family transcriptional regulator